MRTTLLPSSSRNVLADRLRAKRVPRTPLHSRAIKMARRPAVQRAMEKIKMPIKKAPQPRSSNLRSKRRKGVTKRRKRIRVPRPSSTRLTAARVTMTIWMMRRVMRVPGSPSTWTSLTRSRQATPTSKVEEKPRRSPMKTRCSLMTTERVVNKINLILTQLLSLVTLIYL